MEKNLVVMFITIIIFSIVKPKIYAIYKNNNRVGKIAFFLLGIFTISFVIIGFIMYKSPSYYDTLKITRKSTGI